MRCPVHIATLLGIMTTLTAASISVATEVCHVSTSGFPGETFVAEVAYHWLDAEQVALSVEVMDVDGPHTALLEVHYDIPANFSPMPFSEGTPALSAQLMLTQSDAGPAVADVTLAPEFPDLAFVLMLFQHQSEGPSCPERYVARVPSGSVPPNPKSGLLARFRPVDDH